MNVTNLEYNELGLDYDCITNNWVIFVLNLGVSLKCLEITFVVIWCYTNKTEFN